MPLHLCSNFSTNFVNKIKSTSLNMDMKVFDKSTNNTEKNDYVLCSSGIYP